MLDARDAREHTHAGFVPRQTSPRRAARRARRLNSRSWRLRMDDHTPTGSPDPMDAGTTPASPSAPPMPSDMGAGSAPAAPKPKKSAGRKTARRKTAAKKGRKGGARKAKAGARRKSARKVGKKRTARKK